MQQLKNKIVKNKEVSIIIAIMLVLLIGVFFILGNNNRKMLNLNVELQKGQLAENDNGVVTYIIYADRNVNKGKSLGDVNGDGFITRYDAYLIVEAANGNINLEDYTGGTNVADVNGDGAANVNDAIIIMNAVNGTTTYISDLQPYPVRVGETIEFKVADTSLNDITSGVDYTIVGSGTPALSIISNQNGVFTVETVA